MPVTLWQLWAFVAPGLYANERRCALPFVLSTSTLFGSAARSATSSRFPVIFEYFVSLEADYVHTSWTTQAVFSSVATCTWRSAPRFQLPIVLVALALAGVVTPQQLASNRKYAILARSSLGAILTPPDATSQIMLSVPLCSALRAVDLDLAPAGAQSRSRPLLPVETRES